MYWNNLAMSFLSWFVPMSATIVQLIDDVSRGLAKAAVSYLIIIYI